VSTAAVVEPRPLVVRDLFIMAGFLGPSLEGFASIGGRGTCTPACPSGLTKCLAGPPTPGTPGWALRGGFRPAHVPHVIGWACHLDWSWAA